MFRKNEKFVPNSWTTQAYHFLRLLPYISSNESESSNFNIIYTLTTHSHWNIINSNNELEENKSPYENNKWFMQTMAEWFKWMRENDVYENTKIIIVSDHGAHWHTYPNEKDVDTTMFKNITPETVTLFRLLNLNPVLLIKDYNATGYIKRDWRFMSNVDAHYIALDKPIPAEVDPQQERLLKGYVSWWSKDLDKMNKFLTTHHWEVKSSIFDANNWTIMKNNASEN